MWSFNFQSQYLTWIKEWVSLMCDVLNIFSKFSLFPKILASNCLFLSKIIFFDKLLHLSGHVIDHNLNWKKYMII